MVATWRKPKYDWTPSPGVSCDDLNRIEENTQYLKELLDGSIADYGAAILALETAVGDLETDVGAHLVDTANPHEVTKEQLGLGELAEDTPYLPLAGGTMTGGIVGHVGVDYTTFRMRNVKFSTEIPEVGDGENGDVVMQYE